MSGDAPSSSPSKPIIVEGRLFQGVVCPDSLHRQYTIDELRALDLRGEPVMFEHDAETGRIGTIESSHVDSDGWLCIRASIFTGEHLGDNALPEKIREYLKTGFLRDFSIGYEAPIIDSASGRCGKKTFNEASLVRRGKYKGTRILSVQCSAAAPGVASPPPPPPVVTLEHPPFRQQHHQRAGATHLLSPPTTTQPPQKMSSMDSADVLELQEFAKGLGRSLAQSDLDGRTKTEVMAMLLKDAARESAEVKGKLAETQKIAAEYNERLRTEQEPKAQQFSTLAKELKSGDADTIDSLTASFTEREFLPLANVLHSFSSGVLSERAKREETEKKMAEIQKQLDEATEREKAAELSRPADKRRAPDGKFSGVAMSTGGSGVRADGAAPDKMVVEASGNKMPRSTIGAGSDDSAREAKLSIARRLFPNAIVGGDTTWIERASAATKMGAADAGRVDAKTRALIMRAIAGRPRTSGSDEMA